MQKMKAGSFESLGRMADSLKLVSDERNARELVAGGSAAQGPRLVPAICGHVEAVTRPVNFGLGNATKSAVRATCVQ